MKHRMGIAAVFLLCTAVFPAMADTEEERLAGLLNRFLAGASVNDMEVHERFWAEDLVYTSSRGSRFGKAEILKGLREEPDSEEPGITYSAEDIDIRRYGDAAVVAFRLVGTPRAGPENALQYFNTGTFVKREGQWRAVAWQATSIPEPD